MVLTFGYGLVLLALQNITPELVPILIALTIGMFAGIALWKRYISPIHLAQKFFTVITLPIRFYASGRLILSPDEPAQRGSEILSGIVLGGAIVSLVLLPTIPLLSLIILIVLILIGIYGWLGLQDIFIIERRFLRGLKAPNLLDAVALPRLAWWLFLAEVFVILVTTLVTTRPIYESPSNWQLSGSEVEWLTSTAHAAYDGLQEYGRIPRWQPYIAHGEPLIENPFNFIFNPFAGMPSLVLGPVMGLRLSVILSYFLAGLGGWFLGRILGFGSLARILLAMILMGKGNIHTMLNSSYYQLALSQIYMPWVIGGVIAIVRFPKKRWPVILTVLALTLQLFDGNLWYVLPTAVGAVCTALVCVIDADKKWINWQAVRRYLFMGALAIGLSAVFAVPVLLQFSRIGRHTEEVGAGWVAPISDILPLFFDSNRQRKVTYFEPAFGREGWHYVEDVDEFYYSYIIPAWYVLLILVALPLYRPVSRRDRLIGLVALVLFGFATLWGAGGKQPILWLYQNLAPLRQWRFVPRALAVASFWLAVLVAMRLDHLWKYSLTADWVSLFKLKQPSIFTRLIPVVLAGLLIVATAVAASDVNDQWYQYQNVMRPIDPERDACTTWLRQQHPDEQLEVWQQNYADITTFLNNRVRSSNITADFEMLPEMTTVGPEWLNLIPIYPKYAQFVGGIERSWGRDIGYRMVQDSPKSGDGLPCLSQRIGRTLPYAFAVSVADLDALERPNLDEYTDLSHFSAVERVERRADQVALIVTDERPIPLVVGITEGAYPGWRVEVDGQPAKIESVGGQVGVVIRGGEKPVQVYFVYEPIQPVIGGIITLLTAVFCILYLLLRRRSQAEG